MTPQKQLSAEAALERNERDEEFIQVRLTLMGITRDLGAAVMLSRMRYLVKGVQPDKNGYRWTSQTIEQWSQEICLGRFQQDSARLRLKTLGFIVEQEQKTENGKPVRTGKPTLFRVDWEKVLQAERELIENGSYPPADQYFPAKRSKKRSI